MEREQDEGLGEKCGTIIRVKRKRTQTPQETLVLRYTSPAKRRAVDTISQEFSQLSTQDYPEGSARATKEGKILRLVHTTTASKSADWIGRIDDFKKTHKGSASSVQRREKILQHSRTHAKTSRYKLLQMCREEGGLYNIVDIVREDEDKEKEQRFPAIPSGNTLPLAAKSNKPRFVPNIQNARGKKQIPPKQDSFSKFLPLVEEYLQQDVSVALQQNEPTDGEYEYDIYYFDDALEEDDLENKYQLVTLEAFDENSLLYDEYASDHDSEDSNDAENSANDYPEEEGYSSDENKYARTNSSSDSDDRLDWRQETDYHYHAPSTDEEDEENQNAGHGIAPDFEFFYTNWTKMRK